MSERLTRDDEGRRGSILMRERKRGGGANGYLGDSKEINRDREMVI